MKNLQFFKIFGTPCQSYESLSKLGALKVNIFIVVWGEIQMIPESAYKSPASKNWEVSCKYKLYIWPFSMDLLYVPARPGHYIISCLVC